jgi:hypothetical protein
MTTKMGLEAALGLAHAPAAEFTEPVAEFGEEPVALFGDEPASPP